MAIQTEKNLSSSDANAWVHMQTLGDFADLRQRHMESSTYWWSEIGPRRGQPRFHSGTGYNASVLSPCWTPILAIEYG
jgi:hypothetical protein